jgi:hypothetical protein
MFGFKVASFSALRALNYVAATYAACAAIFLIAFIARFYGAAISSDTADWTGMSEMLGALLGPPLALWSIALVLKSLELQQQQVTKQQDQYDQMLDRENMRLDPTIKRVVLAADPMWEQGSFGGKTFHLTVKGDAAWLCSTIPDGPNPAAISNPDGTIEVVLWKKQLSDKSHRGFVQYERSNGTQGWYWMSVSDDDDEACDGLGFVLSRASGPTRAEDVIKIEVKYP